MWQNFINPISQKMNALMHVAILSLPIWIWAVAGQTNRGCECQLRMAVDVFLQEVWNPFPNFEHKIVC